MVAVSAHGEHRREMTLNEFMVICTFRKGTDMAEVFAVRAEEQAAVAAPAAGGAS